MALRPIIISIKGNYEGKGAVQEAKDDLKGVEDAAKGASKGIGASASDANKLKGELNEVSGEFRKVGESVPGGKMMASMMDGISGAKANVSDLRAAMTELRNAGDGGSQAVDVGLLNRGADAAANLSDQLGQVRNVGIGIAAVGTAGVMVSRNLEGAAEEDIRHRLQMEEMLQKRGQGDKIEQANQFVAKISYDAALPDDEPVKVATAQMLSFGMTLEQIEAAMPGLIGQSRLMGTSIESVGQQFGKSFASGNVGMLKRAGVTLSEHDVDYVKEASTEAEKQSRLFEVVQKSLQQYALSMTGGMNAAQISINHAALEMDAFTTNVGQGAQDAHALLETMVSPLIHITNASPGLQRAAGEIFAVGSGAAAGIGGLVAFGAQLGQLYVGYAALRAAKLAKAAADAVETGTETASAGAKTVDTAATTALATAETASATAATAEAAAVTAAGGAAALSGVEAGAASLGHDALAASEGAAALGAEAEAIAVSEAGAASVIGGAGAAAGAVGFGALAVGALAAVAPILAVVAAVLAVAGAAYLLWKNFGEGAQLDANIAKGDETSVKLLEIENKRRAKTGQGALTMEQFQGDADADDKSGGVTDPTAEIEKLKAGLQSPASLPAAPTTPNSAALAPTGDGGGNITSEGGDPYADQIRALMAQKRDLKGKSNAAARDALQKQIDGLKQEERGWKEQNKSARGVRKFEAEGQHAAQIEALQDELTQAQERGDAERVRALTLQIEQLKARETFDKAMASAANQSDAATRAAAEDAARRALDASLKKAQRTADKSDDKIVNAREKDARALAKLDSDATYDTQTEALTDELNEAKKVADVARVRALTLQIAQLKAQRAYDDEMIAARDEDNPAHRAFLEAMAKKRLGHADESAEREADRAARDLSQGDGKGAKDAHDAAIRAQLAQMRQSGGNSNPLAGLSALGSGVNYGDRFAESDALRPLYNAPNVSAQANAFNAASRAAAAPNAQSGRENSSVERDLEVERVEQNARGNIVLTLKTGNIEIPIPRLGQLRGRVGGGF